MRATSDIIIGITMKLFVLLSLLVAASALPTQHLTENASPALPEINVEMPEYVANETLIRNLNGMFGFATLNGGTTGGNAGGTWVVWDAFALRDALNSNDRRIVQVRGRIDLTALFTASPGVRLRVGRFTTITGGDRNAMIFGGGIVIQNTDQVIVRNLKFHNALSYAPGERPNGSGGITGQVAGDFSTVDAIDIDGAQNIWIDHCEFADDPWNALTVPNGGRRHDGQVDMKHGANHITISNNIFRNHNLVMLIGASDNNAAINANRLKITLYGNWFRGVVQRNPRVRFGEVHIYNNLYQDITDYGIGMGLNSQVVIERNVFRNVRRAFANPVSSVSNGNMLTSDNSLISSGQDSGIGTNVNWRPANYYRYTMLATNQVENIVRNNAGIL